MYLIVAESTNDPNEAYDMLDADPSPPQLP